MNIQNQYLDTIFNPVYFAEELYLQNNKTIFYIKDEESEAGYSDFSVRGSGNRILVKSTDIILHNIEEENTVTIKDKDYSIKSILNNNNGTTTITLEKI